MRRLEESAANHSGILCAVTPDGIAWFEFFLLVPFLLPLLFPLLLLLLFLLFSSSSSVVNVTKAAFLAAHLVNS